MEGGYPSPRRANRAIPPPAAPTRVSGGLTVPLGYARSTFTGTCELKDE
jgi:hypothetical protein